MAYYGGGYYASFLNTLQTFGILDFILPFILVFTIVFAVLQKIKLLGDNKNFNVIVALVMGLLFVVPHVMGLYPLGYDPVQVMLETLPSISLVAVAAIMLLILMGIFSTNFSQKAAPLIAIAALIFVTYIFGASLNLWTGPYDVFYWWTAELTELIVIILVFGVIVWFITHEPDSKTPGEGIIKWIGELFERNSK